MAIRQIYAASLFFTFFLLIIHMVSIQQQTMTYMYKHQLYRNAEIHRNADIHRNAEIHRNVDLRKKRFREAMSEYSLPPNAKIRRPSIDTENMDNSEGLNKPEYERETDLLNQNMEYQGYSKTTTPVPAFSELDLIAPMNCTKLAHGDKTEQARIIEKSKLTQNPHMTSEKYMQLARNCTHFRIWRGYEFMHPSRTEQDFPLAFSIRFYHDIEMAERLLRAVYMPNNIYCIYIDKKASMLIHRAMQSITNCLPNVFIASKLSAFTYGSFSPVEADLECMADLLASPVKWRYFLNLAGTEFPLKTNLEIVELLQRLNGINDIEQYPMRDMFKDRITQTYTLSQNLQNVVPTKKEKMPFHANITIKKGCSYNSFSRAFVEWVLNDKLANEIIEWSRDTYSPDETVWGTLNSLPSAPGGYPFVVSQESKLFLSREVLWTRSALKCKGIYQRGICLLGMHELPWLAQSNQLFANKFDIHEDPVAYDCLEELHQKRTLTSTLNINWRELERLPHYKYAKSL